MLRDKLTENLWNNLVKRGEMMLKVLMSKLI